jgi:cytoskeletal protein CcmA (bactofilin family)
MWPLSDKKGQRPLSGNETFTFLGKGAKFKGIITFDGEIRIDARLEGEIHTKGALVVGEHAVIDGDIEAGVVISGGRITGNVTAAEKVQLLAPGVVIGNIRTPLLSVEEGVRFSGSCEADGMGEIRVLEGAREAAAQSGPTRARGAS